jgi:hypothetical protein
MSRGTRQLTLALPLVVLYLLMLVGVVPVPLMSDSRAGDILPVVSRTYPDMPSVKQYLIACWAGVWRGVEAGTSRVELA